MSRPIQPSKPTKRLRVDDALVRDGLAPDLAKARALIMAGQVRIGEQRVDNPSQTVKPGVGLLVTPLRRFVSRGGEKLHYALNALSIADRLKDRVVLDVGAATGGFTDCCLQCGAKKVIALDVGTGLLDWSLRNDPRVVNLEGVHIKDFKGAEFDRVEWVVADISFNSLGRLAPHLRRAAPHTGVSFLLLVKPQFELRAEDVPHGGIVTDDAMRAKAVEQVREALHSVGLDDGIALDSQVAGRHGNREVFFFVTATSDYTE